MKYLSSKQISTLLFIILLLLPNISYSSAWTKSKKEIFGNIEYYVESDSLSTYFKNKNSNFYKVIKSRNNNGWKYIFDSGKTKSVWIEIEKAL